MSDTVKANLNTILLTVLLAVLAWNAKTTYDTALAMARVGANIENLAQRQSVSEKDIIDLRAKIASIELELARMPRSLTH